MTHGAARRPGISSLECPGLTPDPSGMTLGASLECGFGPGWQRTLLMVFLGGSGSTSDPPARARGATRVLRGGCRPTSDGKTLAMACIRIS